ncbi:MAG: HEAT repeat domain-containing protein [Sandaracinaceae bacterium]
MRMDLRVGVAGCMAWLVLACGAPALPPAARAVRSATHREPGHEPECLAYRHVVVVRDPDFDGDARRDEGTLYLERGPTGRLRVLASDTHPGEHRPFSVSDEDAVELYFPRPADVLPARRRLSLPRLVASDGYTEVEIEQTMELESRHGEEADIRIQRAVRVEGQLIEQRGEGRYDFGAGRWSSLRYAFYAGEEGAELDRVGSIELTLDARRSVARGVELQRLSEAGASGTRDYSEYASAHPREEELARIERSFDAGVPPDPALLWFHVHASAVPMWRMLMGRPPGESFDQLVWALAIDPALRGERLPEAVVAYLHDELSTRRDLRLLVTHLGDARFRADLERWARAGDDDELQRAAEVALHALDEGGVSAARVAASLDVPELFAQVLSRYLSSTDDPRDVVPVLIDALAREAPGSWEQDAVLAILTRVALVDIGSDLAAWRRFVDENAARPYSAWMVDGARRPRSWIRLHAIGAIGSRAPFDEGRRAMVAALEDEHPLVALLAAEGLARWGDASGVPLLLDALEAGDPVERQAAFLALAPLAASTLGYDPDGHALERARACGRWRAWATSRRAATRFDSDSVVPTSGRP